MKKLVLPILAMVLASCATEKPMFKPGDIVLHRRYPISFTIDSLHLKPGSKQVFYHATRSDGIYYPYLTQHVIKKYNPAKR